MSKTKLKLILLLILQIFLVGQVVFSQTEKLIKVPGTKCSLIPPDGFVASATFGGFQNQETGSSIMVNELPFSYKILAASFTPEDLKSRGMTLIKKQTIKFNGSEATLLDVTQEAYGTTYLKQILLFGDSNIAVVVNGIYPQSSKELETKIKDALLSTVYDSLQNDNPLEAVSFSIETKDSDFKLVKYLSGSLLYSVDGKIPSEKPTIIVGISIAKVSAQNYKKYAEERLKQLPLGGEIAIKQSKEITIDNLKGYEIVANGKTKDGKAELIYQVMLFANNGDYYIFVGQTTENFDKYLESFKEIAKTFKHK
jgi:hypothetical protein